MNFLTLFKKITIFSTSVWKIWWRSLTFNQKVAPAILSSTFLSILFYYNSTRTDYLVLTLVILGLSYSGFTGRYLLRFFLPLILTFFFYDSQRFYSNLIRGEVHVQEPYLFDKTYFGIKTLNGILTPNEWFQLHTHPVLDLITGLYYLLFVITFVLIAGYFYFIFSQSKLESEKIKSLAVRMMWSFFYLNVIGASTYYWYPAAPPWYVSIYGLGPAQLNVLPNSAGCLRFDHLLGTHIFFKMYSHSADVFGSIPSLHVAYPFQAVIYSFKFNKLIGFCALYYLGMCFSAIYLNHHYIRDIIIGSFYALFVTSSVELFNKIRLKKVNNY